MNYYKSSKKTYETDEEIKELALNYLDKYQPSKKDLRLYLFRKVLSDDQGSANKSIILEQIDKVINNILRTKPNANRHRTRDKSKSG